MPGRLYVVATPIGNLEDLSPRAQRVLSEADRVACEDTRHTGRLLARLGTKRPLVSLHEHNERARVPALLAALEAGETLALVSDAGTPLVSDPGFVLVREAIAAGHAVEAIPGPAAFLVALVVSGLPPHPFTFAGFPPPKTGRRQRFYESWKGLGHTLLVYESPHRLAASLADAATVLGDRPAAVGRELTKLHEEVLRGPLPELAERVAERGKVRGEAVIVIGAGQAAMTPPPRQTSPS